MEFHGLHEQHNERLILVFRWYGIHSLLHSSARCKEESSIRRNEARGLLIFRDYSSSLRDFSSPFKKGGAVVSWSVCSTPDRVVRVRVLAGDIVLCSWARHFTLTVPLSTQVYKWVPANLMLGVTLRWTSIPSRGSRNTPSRFMLQKPEISAGLMGLLGS